MSLPDSLRIDGVLYVRADAKLLDVEGVRLFGLDVNAINALRQYFVAMTGYPPISAAQIEDFMPETVKSAKAFVQVLNTKPME